MMNPCACELLATPAAVGSGGEDDVSVVARRVGQNRFEEACNHTRREDNDDDVRTVRGDTDFALPDDAVIPEILEHRGLRRTQVFDGVFLVCIFSALRSPFRRGSTDAPGPIPWWTA